MPFVTIDSLSGRTVEQKRELVKAITKAFVDIYEVPADRVHVIVRELPRENIAKGGTLLADL